MGTQMLVLLLACLCIFRFDVIQAATDVEADLVGRLEHHLEERQHYKEGEKQLLEELVKRIEQKGVESGTAFDETKQNAPDTSQLEETSLLEDTSIATEEQDEVPIETGQTESGTEPDENEDIQKLRIGLQESVDIEQLPEPVPHGQFKPVKLTQGDPTFITFDLETTDLKPDYYPKPGASDVIVEEGEMAKRTEQEAVDMTQYEDEPIQNLQPDYYPKPVPDDTTQGPSVDGGEQDTPEHMYTDVDAEQLDNIIKRIEGVLDDSSQTQDDVETSSLELEEDPYARGSNYTVYAHAMVNNKTAQQQEQQQKRLEKLMKKVLKKIVKKLTEKIRTKIEIKLLKATSRVLAKIGKKLGSRMLARLGVKAMEKAVAKAAVHAGTQIATQSELAASTGEAAPFVEAACLLFDVLSIGLDIGDAGGYMKMTTKAEYKKLKKEVDEKMKEAVEAVGGIFPAVVGPLDKISDSEYHSLVNKTITDMMNPSNGSPVLQNIMHRLEADISSNKITDSNADDDRHADSYANSIDSETIFDIVCTSLKGKVVDTGNSERQCSYIDRQTCESSYHWPLQENSTDIYAEYRTNIYGGACVTQSYAMRGVCQDNSLSYDTATGICQITETYCKTKGADWHYSAEIKDYDCYINTAQQMAETILGTTIVRGFKQIFDPRQYEKCKANETDLVYFCSINYCTGRDEQWGGFCYPKCKNGFHNFGCCICSPDCPRGWHDDGATCRRAGYCPSNKDHNGALCYDKCRDGYDGNGPVCWKHCPPGYGDVGLLCSKGGDVYGKHSRAADKKACPAGMRDDGTSCWKDTYGRTAGRIPDKRPCPSGMRDDGTSCWKDTYGRGAGRVPDKMRCPSGLRDDGTSCWSDAHIYGKGCCCTIWGCCGNCRRGYHDDGCTCRKTDVGIKLTLFARQRCRSNEDKCGALCYPKCKSGYYNVGCNLCAPHGGAGIKVTLFQRHSCKSNEELNGALCYPKCKPGYRPKGCCLCEPNEGPGIKVTLFQRSYCRSNETNVAAICWEHCKKEYHDDGATCRRPLHSFPQESYGRGVGTPDTKIEGKGPGYGRGFGKPFVHIRPKKRIVPFSTKWNK